MNQLGVEIGTLGQRSGTEQPRFCWRISLGLTNRLEQIWVWNKEVQFVIRQAVTAGLHPGAKYCRIALVRLVGMMLIVFVQETHERHVRNVVTDTVGTGIMGRMVSCLVYDQQI